MRSWDNRKGRKPATVPFGKSHRVTMRRRFVFFGQKQFGGTYEQMTGETNKWARPRREFGSRR